MSTINIDMASKIATSVGLGLAEFVGLTGALGLKGAQDEGATI